MLSYNTDPSGGIPKFQLWRNGTMIKEYQNNTTSDSKVKASITLDLKEGDSFIGKMYGGGNNPTFFVTTFYKISE